jgi:flavin-dependent dehydrogenase
MEKDVLIIGGGPSGISTALHLQKLAPELASRILVLEKERYPRLKLCAGGLVADAEILLQRLGLDASEVPHVDAESAHFDFAGKGLTISLPKSHTLRIIRRDEFDAWLARKAQERGIEIREGITVRDVRPDPGGVTVLTDVGEFRAQVVVGADGSNGFTRRCVLPREPVYTARVLEVLTPGVIANRPEPGETQSKGGEAISSTTGGLPRRDYAAPRNDIHRAGRAYFDFFPVPAGIAGYTWDFPTQVKGQPMRCWGIYDTNILANSKRPPLKKALASEMARFGLNLDDYELKGHPIRWFDPFSQMSVPRVLLVGDAVGADPLFGEGISVALGYGKVAAGELAEAFRRGSFGFAGYRRRVLASPLGQTLIARWLIGYIVYTMRWKWFQFLLWRVLKPFVILASWLFVLNWGRRMR